MTSSQPPSTPKRKLRWYQFSLRTLLIFVTLFGIACSWFAVKRQQAKKQQEAVEAITKSGGHALYNYQVFICDSSISDDDLYFYGTEIFSSFGFIPDAKPPAPDWLRNWLGIDFFSNVTDVTVSRIDKLEPLKELKYIAKLNIDCYIEGRYTKYYPMQRNDPVPNPILENLNYLPRLRELSLASSGITDAELEYLQKLHQLVLLNLEDTPITDAGLTCLKDLVNLKELSLLNCENLTGEGFSKLNELRQLERLTISPNITDAGLKNISGLTQLRVLSLTGDLITDAGMQYLLNLKRLRILALYATKVGDDGLKQLQCLNNLRGLYLESFDNTQFTNTGILYLSKLQQLESLSILCTDDELPSLKSLKKLRILSLSGDKITDNGLESLKSLGHLKELKLPRTKISSQGFSDLQISLPNVKISH